MTYQLFNLEVAITDILKQGLLHLLHYQYVKTDLHNCIQLPIHFFVLVQNDNVTEQTLIVELMNKHFDTDKPLVS